MGQQALEHLAMKIGDAEVTAIYEAPYEQFDFALVALCMQLLGWHPLYSGPGGFVTDQPSEQILRIEAHRMLQGLQQEGTRATGSLAVTGDGLVHFIIAEKYEQYAAEAFAGAACWLEKQKEIAKWRSN